MAHIDNIEVEGEVGYRNKAGGTVLWKISKEQR